MSRYKFFAYRITTPVKEIQFKADISLKYFLQVMKAYRDKTLMTDGLFKIFRNPMYSAYLLFILPGIILLINSWLALTALVLNFILFRLYIRKEHTYLEQRFGIEYQKYLDKVWLKFL